MTEQATIKNILNQYLYGQLDTPSKPVDRLRNIQPGDTDPHTELTVDAVSYMASVGRFANLADARIVRDFFNGSLQRQGSTDTSGVTRLKVSDLSATLLDKAKFAISQYSAGVSESDFATRAMVWGSTSYRLGGETTFVWDSAGNRSIENGYIIPFDDNFDFKTAVGNSFIQTINDTILIPRIDPYGIGQRVELTFDPYSKDQLRQNSIGNYYTQSDYNNYGFPSYVFDNINDIINIVNFPAYASAIYQLKQLIDESGAANYTFEEKGIIYGTSSSDDLSYLSHKGLPTVIDPTSKGVYFVGGDGSDTIKGQEGLADIIYGGNASGADDGIDRVDYSDFQNRISIKFDGSVTFPTITVIDQLDKSDNLYSIEKIIGTKGDDTFSFKGTIPYEYNLLIDSGGGDHDKINLEQSTDTAGLKLYITEKGSGEGYIQSRSGTGGVIRVKNFHTDIIGSEYSDFITDNSSGDHTIDAGGGDDKITVFGSSATINGGAGNDVINLISSSATIQFGVGGGHDVVEFGMDDGDYNLALQNLNPNDVDLIAGGRYIYTGFGPRGIRTQFVAVRIKATGETITFLENGKNIGPGAITYDDAQYLRKLRSITFANGTVLTDPEFSGFATESWGYAKDYANYNYMHRPGEYVDYVNSTYLQASPIGAPPEPIGRDISGTPDNDNIDPGDGDDTVAGDGGADTIQESRGNDTYSWNPGDGDDAIIGSGAFDGFNTLQLGAGVTSADLRFAVTGNGAGLTISFANQAGSISLNDELVGDGYGVDQLLFHDGSVMTRADLIAAASAEIAAARTTVDGTASSDFIFAPSGNFIVNAMEGDDNIWVSGAGSGTFLFSSTDGHDQLNDSGFGYSRNDTLELTDVNEGDVTISRSGDALLVTVNSTGASMNIKAQFKDDDGELHGINSIKFADNAVWTRNQINDVVFGFGTPPLAQAAVASVVEDGAILRGTLVATDPDAGDVLTFKLDDRIPGFALAANGSWSFDPSGLAYQQLAQGEQRVLAVNYHVTDKAGATSASTLTLTVTGTNDMPYTQDFVGQKLASSEELLLDVTGQFFDPDGDSLTFTATLADGSPLPSWLTLVNGQLAGTAPAEGSGNLDIVVSASDGTLAAFSDFRLHFGPNQAPVAQALSDARGGINSPLDIAIPTGTFSDPDDDGLTLSATLEDGTALPDWLSFSDGHLIGTPPETAPGTYDIKIIASDGDLSASSTFSLNIADHPIFTGTTGDDTFTLDTAMFEVTGGRGNDGYLVYGDGGGIFNYSNGDGWDGIDQLGSGTRSDKLVFTDLSSDKISVVRYGDAADFFVDDNNDFWVSQQFSGDNPGGVPQGLDQVQFADGVSWDRNEIRNRADANEILVDASNSYRVGSQDVEAFAIQSGLGEGVIDNFSAIGSDHDYLQFDRSQFDDWAHLLGATVQQGSDLVITLDANDSVRLTGVAMSAFTSLDVRFVGSATV